MPEGSEGDLAFWVQELGKSYHTPIVNAYSETVAVRSFSSHVDVRMLSLLLFLIFSNFLSLLSRHFRCCSSSSSDNKVGVFLGVTDLTSF